MAVFRLVLRLLWASVWTGIHLGRRAPGKLRAVGGQRLS